MAVDCIASPFYGPCFTDPIYGGPYTGGPFVGMMTPIPVPAVVTASPTASSLVARGPMATSNACGPSHGNGVCDTNFAGPCCSRWGWCGSSDIYCGAGCQDKFGHCGTKASKPAPSPGQPKELRCGPAHGNKACPNNLCCSDAGYCGTSKDFCSVPQNCQRKFGRCDSDAVPSGISTSGDRRVLHSELIYDEMITRCKEPHTIAMTFDDGPSENTGDLLNLLFEHGANATFFIGANNNGKGQIDQTAPWMAMIMLMEGYGHQIGSHTWSHPHMNAISSAQRKEEIYKSERAIANIIGKYPTYMRPPYMQCSKDCMNDMKSLGYHVVGWDVDSTDWAHPKDLATMKHAFDQAFDNTDKDGNMLLIQHDTIRASALNLTQHVLDRIQEKGWKAVTLAECLGEPLEQAYRHPDNFEASVAAKHMYSCAVVEGNLCLQLLPFKDRKECFESNRFCMQQMDTPEAKSKKDTVAYHKAFEVCDKQLLFCAQCGHKNSKHQCKTEDFHFKDW